MSITEKQIGENIRRIRKLKGLTIEQLADKYSEVSGVPISSGTVGAWERAEKRISAMQLYYTAMALECPVERLYDQPGSVTDSKLERIFSEYRSLSPEDQSILYIAAEKWQGNTKALIHSVGMYMSMTRKDRAEVAFLCLHQYGKAKEAGRLVPDAPDVDAELIEKEWIRLVKSKEKS